MSNVKLPKSVREQEERANALFAPAPEKEPEEEAEPQKAEPPAAEQGNTDELRRLQSQLDVLQGKYRAEVPRLAAELKDAKDALRVAEQERDQLKQQRQAPAEPEHSLTDAELSRFNDDYGDDFLKAVDTVAARRVAAAEAKADERVAALEAKLESLAGDVTETKQQSKATAEETFWSDLRKAVPNWEAIDADNGWKEWLAGIDEMSGRQRQTLLTEARNGHDARRVGIFFNEYARLANIKTTDKRSELEQQVAPGKSKAQPEANTEKRYTQADMNALYEEQKRGKWMGRDKEFDALERKIWASING